MAGMQQEKQQQQSKGQGKQSLEELIRIVKFRMQQEEMQEQMNGEDEARLESETHRKKKGIGTGDQVGNRKRKRNEKGKGDDKWRGSEESEEQSDQEGKGRGEIGIRKVWEDWWRVREAEWMNEEWRELSGDDLDMEESGVGLRQEQWEEIRNSKMRSEAICKAEKMGEEMENDSKKACKRMSWRNERFESPMEENDRKSFESLQKKVRAFGKKSRRIGGRKEEGKRHQTGDGIIIRE